MPTLKHSSYQNEIATSFRKRSHAEASNSSTHTDTNQKDCERRLGEDIGKKYIRAANLLSMTPLLTNNFLFHFRTEGGFDERASSGAEQSGLLVENDLNWHGFHQRFHAAFIGKVLQE